LQSRVDRRHHAEAENGDVAIGVESVLPQDFAQQGVRPAADTGDADPSSLQSFDVANLGLRVEPKHRPIVSRKKKLEGRTAQHRRKTSPTHGCNGDVAAQQCAAGDGRADENQLGIQSLGAVVTFISRDHEWENGLRRTRHCDFNDLCVPIAQI
jgi:hypothetical protein